MVKKNKYLVIGSNRNLENKGLAQHNFREEFGEGGKSVYMDLFGADIVRDMNALPYPFNKNEFSGILLSHCLEHADPQKIIKILKELYRITKKEGVIIIYVPHYSSNTALTHLTHYKYFGIGTFNTISDNVPGWEKYLRGMFELELNEARYSKRLSFLNFLPKKLKYFWESKISKFIPAHEIKFILRVKK